MLPHRIASPSRFHSLPAVRFTWPIQQVSIFGKEQRKSCVTITIPPITRRCLNAWQLLIIPLSHRLRPTTLIRLSPAFRGCALPASVASSGWSREDLLRQRAYLKPRPVRGSLWEQWGTSVFWEAMAVSDGELTSCDYPISPRWTRAITGSPQLMGRLCHTHITIDNQSVKRESSMTEALWLSTHTSTEVLSDFNVTFSVNERKNVAQSKRELFP